MAKVKIQGNASGAGIFTITPPASATDRTLTLPDSTDTLATETQFKAAGGRKNLIINGAMQVAQRGTSATGLSSGAANGYNSVDRMKFMFSGTTGTVWSQEQSTDAPPNFQYSLKTTATTGSAIATDNLDRLEYLTEADEVHQLGYGTTAPKTSTLSFWTKSNKTGNFTVTVYSQNSSRFFASSVTINTADTWEYKTITISGDTVALTGTSSGGFRIFFTYGAGSDYTSGTSSLDTWNASLDVTMLYKNGTLDVGSSTNDYINITGVQLEVGSVATDFEHRSYGEELALCQRYYRRIQGAAVNFTQGVDGLYNTTTSLLTTWDFDSPMRSTPTFGWSGTLTDYDIEPFDVAPTAVALFSSTMTAVCIDVTDGSARTTGFAGRIVADIATGYFSADAEL